MSQPAFKHHRLDTGLDASCCKGMPEAVLSKTLESCLFTYSIKDTTHSLCWYYNIFSWIVEDKSVRILLHFSKCFFKKRNHKSINWHCSLSCSCLRCFTKNSFSIQIFRHCSVHTDIPFIQINVLGLQCIYFSHTHSAVQFKQHLNPICVTIWFVLCKCFDKTLFFTFSKASYFSGSLRWFWTSHFQTLHYVYIDYFKSFSFRKCIIKQWIEASYFAAGIIRNWH